MKNALIILATLFALNLHAGTLTITPGPNILRRGGEDIPVNFNAIGFAPNTVANIWLVNARTWQQEHLLAVDMPVVNGLNNYAVGLAWSWWQTGPYVARIIINGKWWTSSQIVTTRSAVIWPYPGTVYPRNTDVAVTWITSSYIAADYIAVSLINEDTGERIEADDTFNPEEGKATFRTPNVAGGRWRVCLDGYLLIYFEEYGDWPWPDLSEVSVSGLVGIK